MHKLLRVTAATAAVGMVALLFTAPAQAGNGSAVGAALVGLGIGAILGSALTPQAVYVVPPPPDYYYDPYYDDPYDYDGPVGYEPPAPSDWYGRRTYPRSKTPSPHATAHVPQSAPRTPVHTGAVEQGSEAKLKAAQAKAEKLGGIEKLTSEDVDGLSRQQLKKLRGY
jgi:nucleotide-binding universal stress UspA family protein